MRASFSFLNPLLLVAILGASGCGSEPSDTPFGGEPTFVLRQIDGQPLPSPAWEDGPLVVADTLDFFALRRNDPRAEVVNLRVFEADGIRTTSVENFDYFTRGDSVFIEICPRGFFCIAIIGGFRSGDFDETTLRLVLPFPAVEPRPVWVYQRVR